MHVCGVLVLETPPGGLDALTELVAARLALVPRYRQRVAEVPGHLADPVWVDDREFDLAYHLRRSGLRARAPRRSCSTSCRGWRPVRWTATGRCGRRT